MGSKWNTPPPRVCIIFPTKMWISTCFVFERHLWARIFPIWLDILQNKSEWACDGYTTDSWDCWPLWLLGARNNLHHAAIHKNWVVCDGTNLFGRSFPIQVIDSDEKFFLLVFIFPSTTISRLRSFLCGIATFVQYILIAIATKTYYNIEMWLSLPGAVAFYGTISVIG